MKFKQEDFNTLAIVVLFVVGILFLRKKNFQTKNETIIQQQEPSKTNPILDMPVEKYILNIPKVPVYLHSSIDIPCALK